MAQATALWQWQHYYDPLVVQWGVKLCFTVMVQPQWRDGYWLVRVCADGNLIASLEHHNLRSHTVALFWHWTNQSLPYAKLAEHQAKEWQVSILQSLVWLDQGSKQWSPDLNLQTLDSLISQNGRWMFYSFGHPIWCTIKCRIVSMNGEGGGSMVMMGVCVAA